MRRKYRSARVTEQADMLTDIRDCRDVALTRTPSQCRASGRSKNPGAAWRSAAPEFKPLLQHERRRGVRPAEHPGPARVEHAHLNSPGTGFGVRRQLERCGEGPGEVRRERLAIPRDLPNPRTTRVVELYVDERRRLYRRGNPSRHGNRAASSRTPR